MKGETVLDFAVFQLTPTRTRCELLISSNGASEKLASGLLKPFLAHLRAAEEQIAVGGYSIRLEPPIDESQSKASWFTKGTMQRFVRFVSTPEVLERVSNVETELIQLEEELCNYANEGDDQQSVAGSLVTVSGKPVGKQSKARKDGDEIEGENTETSRCRLIKAMESRHSVLQREQGMAFARAVAAGFDMDHLSDLLAFADYFGAARLSEACHKFAALCKKQQEGGLWLDEMELVAAEGAFAYPESNGTGITIAPAGLAPLKSMIEASKAQDGKAADNPGDNEANQRQSDQHYHGYPHMIGMPPGQIPPYSPWMHFNGEQGYDPRFMPQNPYINGNYGQMNPYWAVPPPGAAYNNANANGNDEAEEEDDGVAEKGRKSGRKSSPRRRTSSPLKKVQVGRQGKRSGMVLIRNINYITGSQDQPKTKNAENGNETDESSEFETSSEIDQGQKQHYAEDRSSRSKKKMKNPRRKNPVPAATEISSESSHASANGKDTTDETYFSVPRGVSQSGGNSYSFDSESIPQHEKRRSGFGPDDSYMLNSDGRAYGRNSAGPYGAEDQIRSSNLASSDGFVMPGRNQGGRFGSGNHESELAFRKAANPESLDDSFIVPRRSGVPDSAYPVSEAYQQHRNRQEESKDTAPDAELQDLFIVPSRPAPDHSEFTRRTLELEMPADILFVEAKETKPESPKFEPEDIWMLPERSVGKESLEKRWSDVNVEMEAMSAMQPKPELAPAEETEEAEEAEEFYEQYHEQRDAKLMKESGSKRAEREARMKSLQDNLEKRKTELSSRFKSTRSSILKTKKEKEEEERRRIEEAAAERRNRIAARTGGSSVRKSQTVSSSSPATKPLARALSSKTTNKEPSSVRKPELGRNPLSRSVSSLEVRKENAKPAIVRQPVKPAESSSSKPTTTTTKPTPAMRKSISSVRELAKPETTTKASRAEDSSRSISRTSLKEGSSILQASSRSASSRSLKSPAASTSSVQEREKVIVPGNRSSKVASSIALSPNESSSRLQQTVSTRAERSSSTSRKSVTATTTAPTTTATATTTTATVTATATATTATATATAAPTTTATGTTTTAVTATATATATDAVDLEETNNASSSIPLEVPQIEAVSFEQAKDIPEVRMQQVEVVGKSQRARDRDGGSVQVDRIKDVVSPPATAKETVQGKYSVQVAEPIKIVSAKETVQEAKVGAATAKNNEGSEEAVEAIKVVGNSSTDKDAAEIVVVPQSSGLQQRANTVDASAKQAVPRIGGGAAGFGQEDRAGGGGRSIPAARPIPPDVEVIYVPHKQHKDSGLKKLLKIGRSLVRN